MVIESGDDGIRVTERQGFIEGRPVDEETFTAYVLDCRDRHSIEWSNRVRARQASVDGVPAYPGVPFQCEFNGQPMITAADEPAAPIVVG